MKSITATNRKMSWFFREDEGGTLDLSPAFQRRPVWTEEQSAYLIDTVLNGLPFPELYIRSKTTPKGSTSYEVIDGQQRLRALLDFARNDLELEGPDVSASWAGRRFDDLDSALQVAFWDYEIVVRELSDASDGAIRDLFRRLNIHAVTLNDQELRHARFKGQFIKSVEALADDEWWTDMRVVNVRQVRRMEDVEFIAELLIALIAGPQDKKLTLDEYFEAYEHEFPDRIASERAFADNRRLIESVLDGPRLGGWNGKSDFYSLFHVFGQYALEGRTFSRPQRASVQAALTKFRREVDQAKKKDNAKVFSKAVHEYAEAVSRAASDVSRRTTRSTILSAIVEKALDKA